MSEPFDPDLSAALEKLGPAVRRLAQLEDQMNAKDAESVSFRFDRLRDARVEILGKIGSCARALNMKPRSLRLSIEMANRHHDRTRRKVGLGQLRRDLDVALTALRSARVEADAEFAIAKHRSALAAQQEEGAVDAADYLDRSRP